MIKENIAPFEDGKVIDEKDIATAVAFLDDAVVFQDDDGTLFYLMADPSGFDIGVVEPKEGLLSADDAPEPLRRQIYASVGKEEA